MDKGLIAFEILQEEWNVLNLEDGTIFMVRPTLQLLHDVEEGESTSDYGARWSTQRSVWAEKKGAPAKEPIPKEKIQQSIEKENLQFRFLERGMSKYRFDHGKGATQIVMKITPTRFDRSSLFDKDGEPVYQVRHEMEIRLDLLSE